MAPAESGSFFKGVVTVIADAVSFNGGTVLDQLLKSRIEFVTQLDEFSLVGFAFPEFLCGAAVAGEFRIAQPLAEKINALERKSISGGAF